MLVNPYFRRRCCHSAAAASRWSSLTLFDDADADADAKDADDDKDGDDKDDGASEECGAYWLSALKIWSRQPGQFPPPWSESDQIGSGGNEMAMIFDSFGGSHVKSTVMMILSHYWIWFDLIVVE